MHIEKKLDVSASDFFELLTQSALADVNQHLPDTTELHTGLTYSKKILTKLGQQATANVTILAYDPATTYQVAFESVRGTNTLGYTLTPTGEHTCTVTVTEAFKGHNSFADTNHAIMSFFMKKRTHKRLHTLLDAMTKHIKAGAGGAR